MSNSIIIIYLQVFLLYLLLCLHGFFTNWANSFLAVLIFNKVNQLTIEINVFSCKDKALQVLMSVHLCVCVSPMLNFCLIPRFGKVPHGYQRLPKVTQDSQKFPKVLQSSKALHELSGCSITFHAVLYKGRVG